MLPFLYLQPRKQLAAWCAYLFELHSCPYYLKVNLNVYLQHMWVISHSCSLRVENYIQCPFPSLITSRYWVVSSGQ